MTILNAKNSSVPTNLSNFEQQFENSSVNKIFNDFLNVISSSMWEGNDGHLENIHFNYPKVNVFKKKIIDESNEFYGSMEYYFQFLCINTNKEDIKIRIQGNDTLLIEGKTNLEDMIGNIKEYNLEYSEFKLQKKWKRKIIIPNIINNTIKTNFNNGLLEIKLISGKRNEIIDIEI